MAGEFTVTWVGTKEVVAKLSRLEIGSMPVVGRALYTKAGEIMTGIKANDVPVANPGYYGSGIASGTLRASGYVKEPVMEPPGRVHVEMGFGGAAAPYAHYQHEGKTWQSGYTKDLTYHGQGGSHYLTGPVDRRKDEIRRAIEEAVMVELHK